MQPQPETFWISFIIGSISMLIFFLCLIYLITRIITRAILQETLRFNDKCLLITLKTKEKNEEQEV